MKQKWLLYPMVVMGALLIALFGMTPHANSSAMADAAEVGQPASRAGQPQAGRPVTQGVAPKADANVMVRGRVVPAQGKLFVELLSMDGRVLDVTRTDENGSYRFALLPSGVYQLRVLDQDEQELLLASNRVRIKPNQQVQEHNLKLALSDSGEVIRQAKVVVERRINVMQGTISGQVTAADTGQPLENVSVYLYNGRDECVDDRYNARLDSTSTDSNGMYSFTGLAAGSYDLEFRPFYGPAEAYFGDRKDKIEVTDGNVTELNVALQRGGQISGRITADEGGAPLANVYVDVYQYDADAGYYRYQGDALTDENGLYTTQGLGTGNYRLWIYPTSWGESTAYLEEYYNDQTSLDSATDVSVTIGQMTNDINASLARGGQISGRVTAEDSGAPLREVDVTVYDANGSYMTYGWTDENGIYTTGAVPTGNYRIKFETYSWYESANYSTEYYNNKSTLSEADPIAVTVGNTTANIDAQLSATAGGAISGLVTIQETGKPFYDVNVSAYDSSQNEIAYDWTEQDGTYKLAALPPNTYYVHFWGGELFDGCSFTEYQEVYYNQKPDLASADPITLNGTETIENINAMLSRDSVSPPPPDTTAPTMAMPDEMTVVATTSSGTVINYQVTASDNTDPNPTVVCEPAPGSTFPMGSTTVTCSVTDASGNQSSDSFTITVVEAQYQIYLPAVVSP